jgi:hypothetical protein
MRVFKVAVEMQRDEAVADGDPVWKKALTAAASAKTARWCVVGGAVVAVVVVEAEVEGSGSDSGGEGEGSTEVNKIFFDHENDTLVR